MAVSSVSGVFQRDVASRWLRFVAVIVDQVFVAIVFVVLVEVGAIHFRTNHGGPSFAQAVISAAQGFTVFAALNGYLLAKRGQTIAKRLFGLRIIRVDGGAVKAGRIIILRYGIPMLIYAVPYLGPVFGLVDALYIFNPQRQCLHDVLADTRVIRVVG